METVAMSIGEGHPLELRPLVEIVAMRRGCEVALWEKIRENYSLHTCQGVVGFYFLETWLLLQSMDSDSDTWLRSRNQ